MPEWELSHGFKGKLLAFGSLSECNKSAGGREGAAPPRATICFLSAESYICGKLKIFHLKGDLEPPFQVWGNKWWTFEGGRSVGLWGTEATSRGGRRTGTSEKEERKKRLEGKQPLN